ncbi:MAG TPA: adenosylmethionine--8-amino-7-oxononanoate transaminase [Desulfobulbaceae bacterium]|nr:MAG: adenosylmethionine--8-amino-7-oxononanoate transaminase [Deltaproteobacteria bacterium RIFOXYD12_FULL_53_23]HCC53312.1 adenosylmethionine--8-amino-7-oxononanoate transaminase [Desulfobulbaceae bacterium]
MPSLQEKDKRFLWHPYTQMQDYAQRDLLFIDRAEGICLFDPQGKRYFDTISSWWCIVHGHGHPTITAKIGAQLARLDQVLLAGTSHEGAILLAEQLVRLAPPELARVFYSDNGSTACEIAIKMSLQYWRQVGQSDRCQLVGIERGYHGDTIGTMSLGGVPEFHGPFARLLFPSHRLPSPYCYRCPVGLKQETCDCQCLQPLVKLLSEQGTQIAALIIEPLIQAAGGMIVYPVKYLQKLAALLKEYGVHLIFDEVATGFGRTGTMFALEQAGVAPDFLCLSKGLTAGMLPMAATLTSEEIFQAFYADYAAGKTFFHGHTFSGNPLAAAAALGSLQVFSEEQTLAGLPAKISHLQARMRRFADLPWVGDLRQLGLISAMELVKDRETKAAYDSNERVGWPIYLAGLERGLLLRPIGNVIYLWLPLSVTLVEIDEITERAWQVLADPQNIAGW